MIEEPYLEMYSPGDFECIFKIYKLTMKAHIRETFGWEEEVQRQGLSRSLSQMRIRVLRYNGEVGGFSVTDIERELFKLVVMCVNPHYQNLGFGRILLEDVKAKSKFDKKKLYGIILPSNDVHSFYEKSGFLVDIETGYICFDPN